jgi:hypothetical protein
MLLWPSMAVLGFLALAGLVVALGRSSTARFDFERNSVRGERQPAVAAVPVRHAVPTPGDEQRTPAPAGGVPLEPAAAERAVAVAAHPAGRRTAEHAPASGWWLVDESADDAAAEVLAGPFPDQVEADWAALAAGLPASVRGVYGVRRPGAAWVRRQSPEERAWLAELGGQLDRLAEDWDELLTDTDPLTTLVVEVAAALVEAGLPLHDCAGRDGGGSAAGGGVCLTPEPARSGVLVSWHQHDRMSRQQVRGAAADATVQQTMNSAVADVLVQLGFAVEPFGSAGCAVVTAYPR